jgi:hypothetical protein
MQGTVNAFGIECRPRTIRAPLDPLVEEFIAAAGDLPPWLLIKTFFDYVRDRPDMRSADVRKVAQWLDRHADRLEAE